MPWSPPVAVRPLVAAMAAWVAGRSIPAADVVSMPAAVRDTLATDLPASGLAISANGQTVFVIDGARGAIVAVDVDDPARRRDVVAAAAADEPRPVAVGFIPGGLVVAVCRAGDSWEVRTYRPGPAGPAVEPLQCVPLGEAGGDSRRITVVASGVRGWMAITGLPPPLPAVLRAVVAGPTVRLLPDEAARKDGTGRAVAAAVSPDDALVVVESPGDGPATVRFLDAAGRTLLRLDAGLSDVRAAAFSRRDGSLWVLAGPASGQPAGLWRLDAHVQDGLQAVRPVRGAAVADPVALVAAADDTLLVAAGNPVRLEAIDVGRQEEP